MNAVTTQDLIPKTVRILETFDQRWYVFMFMPGPVKKDFVSSTTLLDAWGDKGFLLNLRGTLGTEEADRRMHEGGRLGTNVHRAIACLGRKGYVGFLPKEQDEFDFDGRQEVLRAIEICKLTNRDYYILEVDKDMALLRRFDDLCNIINPHVYEGDVTVWTHNSCGKRNVGYAGTLDHVWRIPEGVSTKDVAWYYEGERLVGTTPAPFGNFIVDYKTGYEKREDLLQAASYFMAYRTGCRIKLDGQPLS